MKTTAFLGASALVFGLASPMLIAPDAAAQQSPQACDTAAAVFNPDYDDCFGAYSNQGNPEQSMLFELNDNNVFGSEDWNFLAKSDRIGDSFAFTPSSFFSISTSDAKTGFMTFDIAAIEAAFGPSFATDYELAIGFKASTSISLYKWDAPLSLLNGDTIQWSTAGTSANQNLSPAALSNTSVFFRKVEPVTDVPEPAAMAALGLFGLAGLGMKKKS